MLKLDVEVVFPAVVDGGAGNARGLQFGSESDTRAIERKGVVGENDAEDRHDRHEDNAGDGNAGTDRVLVITDQQMYEDDSGPKHVAIEEKVGGARKEKQRVDGGIGARRIASCFQETAGYEVWGDVGGWWKRQVGPQEGSEQAEQTPDGRQS